MPSDAKPPTRRAPSQARSQQTLEVIFEATRRVAAEHGVEQLTTHRIAERAGVSIGTLYQYFPTREAIVDAIVQRERARLMRELEALLSTAQDAHAPARDIVRAFVRLYVRAYSADDPGHRALVRMAWQADHLGAAVHSLREAAERIGVHPQLRPPSPTQVFVLTRALMGTVRAAMIEDSALLGTPAFEEELTRVCWALLAAEEAN